MLANLSGWHLLVLVAAFVLLFGPQRLPEAARAMGQSLRVLKEETEGRRADPPEDERPPGTAGPR